MKHFNNVLYSESHFPDDSKNPGSCATLVVKLWE